MKKLLLVGFIFVCLAFFLPVSAQEKVEVKFFYSPTCIHCIAEQEFLDGIGNKYPEIEINRYDATDLQNYGLMEKTMREGGVERYLGTVPLTFVGQEFFAGFDNEIGRDIENSIKRHLEGEEESPFEEDKIILPIVGEVNLANYSLPALTVVL